MTTVTDIIDAAEDFAGTAIANATAAMNGAAAAISSIGRTIGGVAPPNLVIAPPEPGDPGDVPEYTGLRFEPDSPEDFGITQMPTLQQIPQLVLPNDVVYGFTDLTYVDPVYPTGVTPDYTLLADVPTLDDLPTVPTAPDLQSEIQGIVAPTLIEIDIPDAPLYVRPEFTGQAPVFDAAVPQDLDLQLRNAYETISPVFAAAVQERFDSFLATNFPNFAIGMAQIEARLNTYLAGGSALSPDVEQAMEGRARARVNDEFKRSANKAMRDAARMGHTIIGPALTSQLLDIDQLRRDANVKTAIEIYVKQAELEQANLQFAVKASTDLRKLAIDSSLQFLGSMVQINGQALDFARATVDAIVKAFDVAARYAETQARIYEADATVYRALLEGAIQDIRAYEATIEGLKAKADVNREQIEAYTARLNAVRIEADVYRSAVEAAVAAATLERTKVELYEAKVRAFGSQVNAETAQFSAYEAAVRGQEARMNVNVAKAREFESKTNAYTAVVNAKAKAVESQVEVNNQTVNSFKVKVDAFAALERAKLDAAQLDVEQYKTMLGAFVAKANAISEKSRSETANYEAGLRGLIAQAHITMEEIREFNKLDVTRAEGLARVMTDLSRQYAGLANAALSGMNSLAASVETSST